jgi:1-acyl-sn-glycerol-3-phosphate acyltransferase
MIIVMNHINWIDIPVIGALLPIAYRLSWLAKSELFENPVVSWWFRQMNVIPIKRGRRDLAALETSADALRGGAVLLIFPEGHRSRNGILQAGRGGAIRLAMQSGAPIVPVAVTGTEHGLRGTLLRKPVQIQIGEPFTVPPTPDGKIPPDQMDQLTTMMMQRISAMLPAQQRGPYQLTDTQSDR